MTISEDNKGIKANITQVLESSVDSKHFPFILDIDVYKRVSFEPSSQEMWPIFQDLREMKNQIFFSHITEETVELYK
jgi:uncharacterized protein (TIGR04255 family)